MTVRNLEIMNADHHRNGVAGMPFMVALVDDPDNDDVKLVVMFEKEGHTAVLSLQRLINEEDISFETNAWRGDQYEAVLRDELWSSNDED